MAFYTSAFWHTHFTRLTHPPQGLFLKTLIDRLCQLTISNKAREREYNLYNQQVRYGTNLEQKLEYNARGGVFGTMESAKNRHLKFAVIAARARISARFSIRKTMLFAGFVEPKS